VAAPTNALLKGGPADPALQSPAVLLSAVTRVFGVTPGLVRVDLRVERGETLLIRGLNGAGKTTLLRIIATALSPTYGHGSTLGFDLATDRHEIRRRVELLGHRTRLYQDLTGRENLRFVCAIHGVDPAGIPQTLERVGLAAAADERVNGYSQGMRQRAAVARALLRAPELLLLDEPYAGLDAEAKEVVDEAIKEAAGEGRTVILATHDPTRGKMATRTLLMDEGRIVARLPSEPAARASRAGTG
jgi:heme exporter protein A